jgi:hypothetical protein
VVTTAATTQTWQVATPVAPSIAGATATVANGGHSLAITRIAGGAGYASVDMRADADMTGGYRLDETQTGGDRRYLHVLSIDGAATAVPLGTSGVTLTLSGGRTATITFGLDTPGATLTLDGVTTILDSSVDF